MPAPSNSRSTWIIALGSAITLWLAFPPIHFWPLAWVATAGWCWLVAQPTIQAKRPYRLVYVAGLVHWLLVMQAVRLPHWSAYFGWLALAAYLAIYIPLFIGLARALVHRMHVPLCLACPIVWTGLEVVRSYFLSGFAMALLAHTQYERPVVLQVAAIGGAYAVSFLLMFFTASLTQTLFTVYANRDKPLSLRLGALWPLVLSSIVMGAAIFLGRAELHKTIVANAQIERAGKPDNRVSVALIQGCVDTTFDETMNPQDTLKDYRRLTIDTMKHNPDVDLIVWPESMQTVLWFDVGQGALIDPDFQGSEAEFQAQLKYGADVCRHEARWFARNFNTAALFGSPSFQFGNHPLKRYNSALWFDAAGNKAGRYDKMHPVMFGEYVPLGNIFPFLYRLTPMGNGLEPGEQPLAVTVPLNQADDEADTGQDALTICPCICFENTVPHLIRRQVRTLTMKKQSPDALVTITNDGWFWGSNLLDQHLACGVFRAIEMRRPMLIAANTGFSVWIDNRGQILKQGPRHAEAAVIAQISPNRETATWYEHFGDSIFGFPCAIACLVAAVMGWLPGRRAGMRDLPGV